MPIRLEDLLSSFQRHLRTASKAPRTIELYSQSVRYFSRWLAEHDRPATPDELTRHAVRARLADVAENCQPSTVATRLRGWDVRAHRSAAAMHAITARSRARLSVGCRDSSAGVTSISNANDLGWHRSEWNTSGVTSLFPVTPSRA